MNYPMVRRLILKDWYFNRWSIAGYLIAGALALAIVGLGNDVAFTAGSIVLVSVLIAVGIHLAMATVINERSQHTLPFVMSLPISAREYTLAKVLANVLIFLVPWTTMVIAAVILIASRAALPDGLIPFVVIMLTEILVSTCLILAVALVTESQAWTVCAVVFGNLFFQAFLYYVAHLPSVARAIATDSAAWNSAEIALLGGEVAAIAGLLGLTFWFQSRKTDFI
ncbi:MAG TPA: ABC-2 transporter permease [Herpetosiphonaceae bacterium]|nr:ABC-2 transporter permease [Herpetosiphonaceae bacterium]